MPRAGHKDVIVERGTTWRLAFQLWLPAPSYIAAGDLVPGDHIIVDGIVQTVLDITATNGSVAIRFGQGAWSDPALTVKADAMFQEAAQDIPLSVRAAYEYDYPVVDETGGPLVVDIPSFIDEGGSILITLDRYATWALPAGTGQWDVTLEQSNSEWMRALEGQFSAIHTVSGEAVQA